MKEESKQKLADSQKGNKYSLGRILSEESRQKISNTLKGNIPVNKGKKESEEFRQKLRDAWKIRKQKKLLLNNNE